MWPHTTLQLWMWPVPLGPAQTPWSQQSTGSRQGCPPIGMLAAGLHWNRLPFSFSLEFMQHWVHATHIHSHTCMLEHWQKLLWNCLGLCCFSVFSWQLKHLAYIKLPWRNGQLNLICCIGHRVFHFPKICPYLTSLCSEPASLNFFICWYKGGVECFCLSEP